MSRSLRSEGDQSQSQSRYRYPYPGGIAGADRSQGTGNRGGVGPVASHGETVGRNKRSLRSVSGLH